MSSLTLPRIRSMKQSRFHRNRGSRLTQGYGSGPRRSTCPALGMLPSVYRPNLAETANCQSALCRPTAGRALAGQVALLGIDFHCLQVSVPALQGYARSNRKKDYRPCIRPNYISSYHKSLHRDTLAVLLSGQIKQGLALLEILF